jgi:hypothetical protein
MYIFTVIYVPVEVPGLKTKFPFDEVLGPINVKEMEPIFIK